MNGKTLMLGVAALALSACQAAEDGNEATGNAAAPGAAPAASGSGDAKGEAKPTMAAVISQSGDLGTLLRALRSTGLEQTLAGPGPYTLFAPVDASFQKLPAGTVDSWMQADRKAQLTGIITNHLVPGVVTKADLERAVKAGGGKTQLATIGGTTLTVTREGEALVVSGAAGSKGRIRTADLTQANGVIHKIDGLLTTD